MEHLQNFRHEMTIGGHSSDINYILPVKSKLDTLFATASSDSKIKLWDIKKGTCCFTLSGHSQSVTCLEKIEWEDLNDRQHPTTIISGSDDTSIKIWDLEKFSCTGTLAGHQQKIVQIAILPKKNNKIIIVSGSQDCSIRFWDFENKTCDKIINAHNYSISSLIVIPHWKVQLASCSFIECSIKLWSDEGVYIGSINANTYKLVRLLDRKDDTCMISLGSVPLLQVWELQTGQCIKEIAKQDVEEIRDCIALRVDKTQKALLLTSHYYSRSKNQTFLRLWDFDTITCIKTIPLKGDILCLALSTFHKMQNVIILGGPQGALSVYDLDNMKQIDIFEDRVVSLIQSIKDKLCFATINSNKISLWKIFPFFSNILFPFFLIRTKSPNLYKRKYILTCIADFCISQKKLLKKTQIEYCSVKCLTLVEWSINSTTIVFVGDSVNIIVYSLENSLTIQSMSSPVAIYEISYVKWSRDESSVLTLSSCSIRLWNIVTGNCLLTFSADDDLFPRLCPIQSKNNDTYAIFTSTGIAELSLNSLTVTKTLVVESVVHSAITLPLGFAYGTINGVIGIWYERQQSVKYIPAQRKAISSLAEVTCPESCLIVSLGSDYSLKIHNCDDLSCLGSYHLNILQLFVISDQKHQIIIAGRQGCKLIFSRLFLK